MAPTARFDTSRGWELEPQVSLRDESFGALAYHYGTRRLVFLKSRRLVELVGSLDRYPTAAEALTALVEESEWPRYEAALGRLAGSAVIRAR